MNTNLAEVERIERQSPAKLEAFAGDEVSFFKLTTVRGTADDESGYLCDALYVERPNFAKKEGPVTLQYSVTTREELVWMPSNMNGLGQLVDTETNQTYIILAVRVAEQWMGTAVIAQVDL